MLARLLLALLAATLGTPTLAQSSAQLPNTKVELITETRSPAPGKRFTIGLAMTPKPGWHTYWENPGDSGMPTSARWTLPAGATASPLSYPVPETYIVAGLMNHVYSAENILLADIDVPASHTGDLPLKLRLDWLVCDDSICVPEGADLALTLPPGDGALDPATAARFTAARNALPRPLAEPASFARQGERVTIAVPLAATDKVTGAHFFAGTDDAVRFASPQAVRRTDTALIVETDAVPGAAPAAIPGLLRIERGDEVIGFTLTATPGAVPAGEPLARTTPAAAAGFLPAFGLALLGGLLLNLMPCVFPILSLKAMSLARAGGSEADARQEGLAYTAGVVLVTTLLGLVAILLARAGAGAGWAFQLQDPRVILFLLLLSLAIALNFAGLFETDLGTANAGSELAAAPGARGAFFTGALAAFVATPCTGPFMAGALGAALLLPPAAGLAVFAGLGLGLALPFLAVGFVPALRRRLPRPGPWMAGFRRILAVPMFLTALALAWVLGRQAGLEALVAGLGAALAVGLALWMLGLRQRAGRPTRLAAGLALALAIAMPLALGRLPLETPALAAAGPEGLAGTPFSPDALAAARAQRTPTFLYFTADWCITCKVNEKGALADPAVARAFRDAGIQVMVGDWTRPDPAIARFLEQQGRAGIPLYLFYGADGSTRELPQLLTVDALTALASPRSAATP
jgi:thiol:disulfide interchange protein